MPLGTSGRPRMIIRSRPLLTGALVGLLLWSRLRTLAYRRPDDDVHELDRRPTHRWVLFLVPLAWTWLTFALAPTSWWAVLLWLPLSLALTWASAVDLDVRRLPDRSPRGWPGCGQPWSSSSRRRSTTGRDPWWRPRWPRSSAHVLLRPAPGESGRPRVRRRQAGRGPRGGVGWHRWVAPVVALTLLGCLIALIGMAATRRRDTAFGPCLAVAAVITVGVAVRFPIDDACTLNVPVRVRDARAAVGFATVAPPLSRRA